MRAIIAGAALPLLIAGAAAACPPALRAAAPLVLADNAVTPSPAPAAGETAKKPDAVAFPGSPNGSPAAGDKGLPVVTDKAACTGTGPTATCADTPRPSDAADTSSMTKTTPTTVDGTAPARK